MLEVKLSFIFFIIFLKNPNFKNVKAWWRLVSYAGKTDHSGDVSLKICQKGYFRLFRFMKFWIALQFEIVCFILMSCYLAYCTLKLLIIIVFQKLMWKMNEIFTSSTGAWLRQGPLTDLLGPRASFLHMGPPCHKMPLHKWLITENMLIHCPPWSLGFFFLLFPYFDLFLWSFCLFSIKWAHDVT